MRTRSLTVASAFAVAIALILLFVVPAASGATARAAKIGTNVNLASGNLLPEGVPFETLALKKGKSHGYYLKIGRVAISNPLGAGGFMVVFINRRNGSIQGPYLFDRFAGMGRQLERNVKYAPAPQYTSGSTTPASPGDLVAIVAAPGGTNHGLTARDHAAIRAAIQYLGGPTLKYSTIDSGGFSVLGIPNAPAGSAWEDLGGVMTEYGAHSRVGGDLVGRLVPDSNTNWAGSNGGNSPLFELTFTNGDYVPYNTALDPVNQTPGIYVGTPTPTLAGPPAGSTGAATGGFTAAALNPYTLKPIQLTNFCTVPGCPNPTGDQQALASWLAQYSPANASATPALVMLQSFGNAAPGTGATWGLVANQIIGYGGDPDLLNTFENYQGGYAFVGGSYLTNPFEAVGGEAHFDGLLARGPASRFRPVAANSSAQTYNEQLPQILNSSPYLSAHNYPFPFEGDAWLKPFEKYIEHKAGTQFGGHNHYCPFGDCLRALYWEDPNLIWGTHKLTNLRHPPPGKVWGCPYSSKTQCQALYVQAAKKFNQEFDWVDSVNSLMAGVSAAIPQVHLGSSDALTQLTQSIQGQILQNQQTFLNQQAVAGEAFGVISGLLGAGSALPEVGPVLGVLSSAVSVAGAITAQVDGYPALQGQLLTTASNLGSEIDRQFAGLAKAVANERDVILTDYGRLSVVGKGVAGGKSSWVLPVGDTEMVDAMALAEKRYIYLNLYRSIVNPPGGSPTYTAFCEELGTRQSYAPNDDPGNQYATVNYPNDPWYTFLVTYAESGATSPYATAEKVGGDYAGQYGPGAAIYDTTGPRGANLNENQLGPTASIFQSPSSSGLGFSQSEFYWKVFTPYGTSNQNGVVGSCFPQ